MAPTAVEIQTGARLHFGLLASKPAASRSFGGAGLMIDVPGFRVSVAESEADCVAAPELYQDRVWRYLQNYRQQCHSSFSPATCRIDILETIDPHVGLGSGTQLGMAVALALSLMSGEVDVPAGELAQRVGRGGRSALGLHGFAHGGLLVDGGRRGRQPIAPLVARAAFPNAWRILLATPRGQQGLSGASEVDAFERLEPMPVGVTERLCRILLMDLLPAVHEADFSECGEALYQFGHTVGEYFSAVQHGVYCQQRTTELVNHLRDQGVRGVGQTSWGPTIFMLCQDEAAATSLRADLLSNGRWSNSRFTIARALNTGAKVDFHR